MACGPFAQLCQAIGADGLALAAAKPILGPASGERDICAAITRGNARREFRFVHRGMISEMAPIWKGN
jgi:hypothetical protein